MPSDNELFTLHRYFLWAHRRVNEFFSRGASLGMPPTEPTERQRWTRANFVNLAPWLGSLYVVIEGWKELRMSDSEIDLMLKSDKIDSLRRFRNGVFHFHKSYFDDRFLELFSADGVQWALDIHKEFDRYFKVWFESQGYSIEFSSDTNGNLTTTVSTPPND